MGVGLRRRPKLVKDPAPRKRGGHLLVCLLRGPYPIVGPPSGRPMAPNPDQARPGTARAMAAAAWAGLWASLLLLALRLPPDGHEHGDLGQFIGRLHPLLVHGPVALLALVPLLELAGLPARRAHLRSAAGWILVLAAGAALPPAPAGGP